MSLFDEEAYRPPARANGMRFAPTTTAGRGDEVTSLFLLVAVGPKSLVDRETEST